MNSRKFFEPSTGKIILTIIIFIVIFFIAGIPEVYSIMCEPCLFLDDCSPCKNQIQFTTFFKIINGTAGGVLNFPIIFGLIIIELMISYIIACLVRYEYSKYIKKTKLFEDLIDRYTNS